MICRNNKYLGSVKCLYLGRTQIKICIREEIKDRLKSENACCTLVFCFLVCCRKIIEFIILLAASYECETWSLPLREVHRLTVFESRVRRRTRGEVIGSRSKLYNEEIHNLHPSSNIIIMIKSGNMG